MDLIYADKNRIEKGVLNNYSLDLEIGKNNDFQLVVGRYNHKLTYQDYFYIVGTEYGGIVDNIQVNTAQKKIYYKGRNWRGVMGSKIIQPFPGDDYRIVNGDAHEIINELILQLELYDLFEVPDVDSGIYIQNYSFDRYTDLNSGLMKMLTKVSAKLKIRFKNRKVLLTAEPVYDYSEEYEYSEDGNVDFIIQDNRAGVNHLICLGKGELSQRMVRHLYLQKDGTIGTNRFFDRMEEVTAVLDYPNAESEDELINKGIERIHELSNSQKLDMKVQNVEVELGDIVGGRERVTGLYIAREITQKIVKISNNKTSISYEVGN